MKILVVYSEAEREEGEHFTEVLTAMAPTLMECKVNNGEVACGPLSRVHTRIEVVGIPA